MKNNCCCPQILEFANYENNTGYVCSFFIVFLLVVGSEMRNEFEQLFNICDILSFGLLRFVIVKEIDANMI